MEEKNFWRIFHAAWGHSTTNKGGYDKESWMQVQHQVAEFFENQKRQDDKESKEQAKIKRGLN